MCVAKCFINHMIISVGLGNRVATGQKYGYAEEIPVLYVAMQTRQFLLTLSASAPSSPEEYVAVDMVLNVH